MRSGRRVAFDFGKVRIGVSSCDLHAILASPQPHILTAAGDSIDVAKQLVLSAEAIEVYVGLPLNLQSAHTESTDESLNFARELQAALSIDVRLVDERFSTKVASDSMRSAGKDSRSQRAYIDSAAATVILESALEQERRTGKAPGKTVAEYDLEN